VLYVASEPAPLYYDSTDGESKLARERMQERLPRATRILREEEARRRGLDPALLEPIAREPRNVAPQGDMSAYVLSFVLPMLLVVMAVMGAFFPAVDLTAGEKERNTAETTLLLPVPRLAVHQGKILAVCATAVLASALNLLALALSAGHLLSMLSQQARIEVAIPAAALVALAPLAVLFAFFVSAVLTGVAAFARTFKEGQALLGPVQLLFIAPALAGAIPGLELGPGLALVPVLNVVLAFRALLQGRVLELEYLLTALALAVYAALAIVVCVRVLSREAWLVSEGGLPLWRALAIVLSPGTAR
jgi:sodium transport system permease protein